MASSKLINKDGSTEPKAVLSLYEDFLCPHCGDFEQQFGPTVNKLIDTGAIAADYYMVAHPRLGRNAELLVARGRRRLLRRRRVRPDAFRRFHAALYAAAARRDRRRRSPTTRG